MKYTVSGVGRGSKYLGEFDSESGQAAIDLALESAAATVSLCHRCSDECEDPQITEAFADVVE